MLLVLLRLISTAMRTMHEAQAKGGKVVAFTSFCGGLPRVSDNDNPFGYKVFVDFFFFFFCWHCVIFALM
jgi:hypothetical protein